MLRNIKKLRQHDSSLFHTFVTIRLFSSVDDSLWKNECTDQDKLGQMTIWNSLLINNERKTKNSSINICSVKDNFFKLSL